MLRVTVELEPFGDSSKAKHLAQICVGNVTKECEDTNYIVLVQEPAPLRGEPIDRVFRYYPNIQNRQRPVTFFLSDLINELELALEAFSDVMDALPQEDAEYYRNLLQNKR